ncbi:MAG: glycosyltransferase [Candidatus Rifleibacteriota bacterium]
MKILVLNESNSFGGAAKAAKRIYSALKMFEPSSLYAVQRDVLSETAVLSPRQFFPGQNLWKLRITGALRRLFLKNPNVAFSFNIGFSSFFKGIVKKCKPEILQLNWLNNSCISLNQLEKLNIPIVWTLHDSWAFTGGCHVFQDCLKFQHQCGYCPLLQSNKYPDLSSILQNQKERSYSRIKNLHFVTPSKWLKEKATSSRLLRSFPIYHIPNPIDQKIFYPLDSRNSRQVFNLPIDKKLVLLNTFSIKYDLNKGTLFLAKALQEINDPRIEVMIIGCDSDPDNIFNQTRVHFFGKICEEKVMNQLYAAADVVALPSKQENFSNTLLESSACGRPSVCFDIGGNSEVISHLQNGYIAKPFIIEDLANGIKWSLGTDKSVLKKYCSKKISENYSYQVIGEKYQQLCSSILKRG